MRPHGGSRPRKSAGVDAELARNLESGQYVGRAPRGRNCNEHVPSSAQGLHLAREEMLIAVIVADGRQDRGIGRQRDCGQAWTIVFEPADKLTSEMLRIGRATAIAGK